MLKGKDNRMEQIESLIKKEKTEFSLNEIIKVVIVGAGVILLFRYTALGLVFVGIENMLISAVGSVKTIYLTLNSSFMGTSIKMWHLGVAFLAPQLGNGIGKLIAKARGVEYVKETDRK